MTMTGKNFKCGGCLKAIKDKYFIKCCVCCRAGVSEQRFRNTLTDAYCDAWKCVLCLSKLTAIRLNAPVAVRCVERLCCVRRNSWRSRSLLLLLR